MFLCLPLSFLHSLHELITLLSSSFCFLFFLTLFSSLPLSVFFSSSLCFLLFLSLSLPVSGCPSICLSVSVCLSVPHSVSVSHSLDLIIFFSPSFPPSLILFLTYFSPSLLSLPYFTLFSFFSMPKHFFLYRQAHLLRLILIVYFNIVRTLYFDHYSPSPFVCFHPLIQCFKIISCEKKNIYRLNFMNKLT